MRRVRRLLRIRRRHHERGGVVWTKIVLCVEEGVVCIWDVCVIYEAQLMISA